MSDGIVDELIRVGLMFGAVFQVICIAAVIWIPSSHVQSSHGSDGSGCDQTSGSEDEDDAVSIEGASSTTSSYTSGLPGQGVNQMIGHSSGGLKNHRSRRRERKKHK